MDTEFEQKLVEVFVRECMTHHFIDLMMPANEARTRALRIWEIYQKGEASISVNRQIANDIYYARIMLAVLRREGLSGAPDNLTKDF